jgi:hypothetical protein
LLKFFEVEARLPEDPGEVPAPVVAYVAQQVKVPAENWAAHDRQGRAITRKPHGDPCGFRVPT